MIRRNRIEMAQRISYIVNMYHERGNHKRSLRKVWAVYVYPVYAIGYRTMMDYLRIAREHQLPDEMPPGLYPLFDQWNEERKAWTT